MGKKQAAGENSRKAAGNAKKAEVAASKAAVEKNKKDQAESEEWSKGAKSNAKAEAAALKQAELNRKKAEKEALLKAEEAAAPSGPKNSKKAEKKPAVKRGLDLSQLDDSPTSASPSSAPSSALNASNIDDALDALALTSNTKEKVDRHPERRFKAAYAEFEERRLQEMDSDGSGNGLRKNQKQERIRKEFEKSPLNPYNQITGRYDSTKGELAEILQNVQAGVESRLAGN